MGLKILNRVNEEDLEKLKAKLKTKSSAKAYRKLYQLFLANIDELSSTQIKKLDAVIAKYSSEIMFNGGWAIGRKDIISHDSKQVSPDYITFRVVRDLDGFHQQPEPPKGLEVGASRQTEQRFLEERKVELDLLHKSMLMKDDILFNHRYTVEPSKESLVAELAELLGYNHPELTILPPAPIKEEEVTVQK